MNYNQLIEKIEKSRSADFGDIFSKAIDLYKEHFSIGVIHLLIIAACYIPLFLIVYLPMLPYYFEILQNAGDPYYEPSFLDGMGIGMLLIWYLLVFAISILMQIVNTSIIGHFYQELRKQDLGITNEFQGYFHLLKRRFGTILVLVLVTTGIAIVASLLCYIPLIYAIVPIHWIIPIFIFNQELSVSEITKAAFKFANKNWLIFFILGFVCLLLSMVGALLCYIGLVLTAFFAYIATYVTYRDLIGFDQDNPINEIGLIED